MTISIITVCYNPEEKNIKEAIDSVLSQTYKDIEYIIIDGASSNNWLNMLPSYEDKFAKFRLISEKDHGIYDAMNKGIALSTGDIIGFLHSDDLYANKNIISNISEHFKKGAEAVYGDLIYVNKDDTGKIFRYWKSGDFSQQKLKYGWMPPHPTFFTKRSIYEETKLTTSTYFDCNYSISADYDIMTRILSSKIDYKIDYIPEVLVKMRVGGVSNRSLKSIILKSQEDWQIIKNHKLGGITTLALKNFRKVHQLLLHN